MDTTTDSTALARTERREHVMRDYGCEPGDDADGTTGAGAPDRFLLIEKNVGGSTPPYYFTDHESPDHAGSYHVSQEYFGDWEVVTLVDLLSGQTYDAERVGIAWTRGEVLDLQ